MKGRVWTALSLVIACLVAALALSQVYLVTRPKIEKQKSDALRAALSDALPAASQFAALESAAVWAGRDAQGKLCGIVFKASPHGYAGPFTLVVGLDTLGRITGIGVGADIKETPGLGLKARDESFRSQFRGLSGSEMKLSRDGGTIDAISAATITSRAIVQAVREGAEQYSRYLKEDRSGRTDTSDAMR